MSKAHPRLLRLVLDNSLFAGTFSNTEYRLEIEAEAHPITKAIKKMDQLGKFSLRNVLRIILHTDKSLPDFILSPANVVRVTFEEDGDQTCESNISESAYEDSDDSAFAGMYREFVGGHTCQELTLRFYAEERLGVENLHRDGYGDVSVAQALSLLLTEAPKPESLTPAQQQIFAPFMTTAKTLSNAFHDRGQEWCDSILGHARRSQLGIQELLVEAGEAH